MWYWIVAGITLVIGIVRIGFRWHKWKEDKYGFDDKAAMNVVGTVFASVGWPAAWILVTLIYLIKGLWQFGMLIHNYTIAAKKRAKENHVSVRIDKGSNFHLKDAKPIDSIIQLLDPSGKHGMNRIDVIRNALNLYATIAQYTRDGSKLMVGKSKEDIKIQIEVPGVVDPAVL